MSLAYVAFKKFFDPPTCVPVVAFIGLICGKSYKNYGAHSKVNVYDSNTQIHSLHRTREFAIFMLLATG